MAAIDTWTTTMTDERDECLAALRHHLAQEDAVQPGSSVFHTGTRDAIQRLAQAQARLDAITAAAE